jgi:L-serine dehydratase
MNAVSIFNDVIGPVMRGPSSSHCAAALRIGRLARDLMDGDIGEVLVEFDRAGSLPTTHESQGSDMGLFGGLLGWDADDERLPGSAAALAEAGIRLRIETVDVGDPHPNTYRLTLKNERETHTLIAISTGGGMIEVLEIDGVPMHLDGGYHETLIWLSEEKWQKDAGQKNGSESFCPPSFCLPDSVALVHDLGTKKLIQIKSGQFAPTADLRPISVKKLFPVLPVPSRKDLRVPFTSCAELLELDGIRQTPLWQLAVDYERARGNFTEAEVLAKMTHIVRILRKSVASGIAGTSYEDRVLHHQSGRFADRMSQGRLLDGGALNRIILYVTALMEVKSSMGVIVAAPTAGACAALPGAVIAMAESMDLDETEMAKAMLVTLAGGTRDQAIAAASLAFQSMLGLICDPIANRVEAPCLGKNVMAAANALSCANMALADFDPLIPLDEVIDAAKSVAERMPREHRCTSLGGLAVTPTSLEIERKLAALKGAGCGSCGC